jgi:hypothetical protein
MKGWNLLWECDWLRCCEGGLSVLLEVTPFESAWLDPCSDKRYTGIVGKTDGAVFVAAMYLGKVKSFSPVDLFQLK